jgi:hypothetical protein
MAAMAGAATSATGVSFCPHPANTAAIKRGKNGEAFMM